MKIFLYLMIAINIYANNFTKHCQQCHGHSPGKYPLSFEQISIDFVKHEFISYLKYDKNKSSVHNYQIDNKTFAPSILAQMKKASSLDYDTRDDITEFIYSKQTQHQCMW
jgi:hypothetical protein